MDWCNSPTEELGTSPTRFLDHCCKTLLPKFIMDRYSSPTSLLRKMHQRAEGVTMAIGMQKFVESGCLHWTLISLLGLEATV